MRLYKYISPILLFLLITSITINTSSFSTTDFGRNNFSIQSINNTGTLKRELDKKFYTANGPLKEVNTDGYNLVKTGYGELGNVGGEKYWSWYGFTSHQPWCACFVSWCADQNGLIEKGVIPSFAGVSYGASWFMGRNEWIWGNQVPSPGMIIFFDFTNMNLDNIRDGVADHVGIVEKVENGYVYAIEGNYNNACVENTYAIGHYNILGYGVPNY